MATGVMVSYMCRAHPFGATEEYCHQVTRILTDMGQEISYLTFSCPHSASGVGQCPDPGALEQFDATCGYPVERIRVPPLGLDRWNTLVGLSWRLRFSWNLVRAIQRKRPEYVIVNNWAFMSAVCCLAGRVLRIPVIVTVHHVNWDVGPRIRGRLRRAIVSFHLKFAEVNACVSESTASDVVQWTLSDRVKTTVIPNAIDLVPLDAWRQDADSTDEGVSVLRGLGFSGGNGPIIFTVARLVEYKGIQWVIRALPRILEEFPDARYVVAGDGPFKAELEETVKAALSSEQRDAVTFLGFVSTSEKFALYNACDMFAMPSTLEGFGIVYSEAGAFGKPSIGCDVMGVPEAIAHEQTGLLVPPNDSDAVAEAILRLLRDDGERERMGAAARKRVELMGTWEDRARQYQQLIEGVTRKRRKR